MHARACPRWRGPHADPWTRTADPGEGGAARRRLPGHGLARRQRLAEGRPGDHRGGPARGGRARLRAEPGRPQPGHPAHRPVRAGRARAGQPGVLRRPVLPRAHHGASARSWRRPTSSSCSCWPTSPNEPRPDRAVRAGPPRRRRDDRLDARRRPAARRPCTGWASRWSANGRPLRPAGFPYVDVDHAGGVDRRRCATCSTVGRTPDRHHRRPAGHGGRDRPAGRLPQRAAPVRRAARSWRSATSPASPARRRCASCWPTIPTLDAVFVASDLMADGALRTLRQAGRRVPDDVAVIGFDDVEIARYTEPPLTTVRQPIAELGPASWPASCCGWPRTRTSSPPSSSPPNSSSASPPDALPRTPETQFLGTRIVSEAPETEFLGGMRGRDGQWVWAGAGAAGRRGRSRRRRAGGSGGAPDAGRAGVGSAGWLGLRTWPRRRCPRPCRRAAAARRPPRRRCG